MIVKIDYPIGKVFLGPELVGHMIFWSVELFKFDLSFELKGSIKAQYLAEFVSEL